MTQGLIASSFDEEEKELFEERGADEVSVHNPSSLNSTIKIGVLALEERALSTLKTSAWKVTWARKGNSKKVCLNHVRVHKSK